MAKKKKEEIIEKFLNERLDDIMSDRFGSYSKYIIQERALPDARDGLKPVQRRILYSMYIDGNTYEKPHRKSAKTVGSVMGTFHPHGDSSIYEAMVRMSQDWKINVPLIVMYSACASGLNWHCFNCDFSDISSNNPISTEEENSN